jgi:hypothetical protein
VKTIIPLGALRRWDIGRGRLGLTRRASTDPVWASANCPIGRSYDGLTGFAVAGRLESARASSVRVVSRCSPKRRRICWPESPAACSASEACHRAWSGIARPHPRPRRSPSEAFAAFCGQLKTGWVFCEPADPQAKGAVERLQGYAETNFEPGRRFANHIDFQDQLDTNMPAPARE